MMSCGETTQSQPQPPGTTDTMTWLRCRELLCSYVLEVGGSMAAVLSLPSSHDFVLHKLGGVDLCLGKSITFRLFEIEING